MLTQIWSVTDSYHFRSFFALLPYHWPRKLIFWKNVKNTWRYYPFTHAYHKSRPSDIWFLRYKVQRTEFFVILGNLYPLTLLTTQKNRNFEKIKKHLKIYDDHMRRGSWDIKLDRQNFLSFQAIFCPFIPLTTQKIKILKKWKKLLEVLSF